MKAFLDSPWGKHVVTILANILVLAVGLYIKDVKASQALEDRISQDEKTIAQAVSLIGEDRKAYGDLKDELAKHKQDQAGLEAQIHEKFLGTDKLPLQLERLVTSVNELKIEVARWSGRTYRPDAKLSSKEK